MKDYPEEGWFWDMLDVLTGILIVSGLVAVVYFTIYFGITLVEV